MDRVASTTPLLCFTRGRLQAVIVRYTRQSIARFTKQATRYESSLLVTLGSVYSSATTQTTQNWRDSWQLKERRRCSFLRITVYHRKKAGQNWATSPGRWTSPAPRRITCQLFALMLRDRFRAS